jgi:hypothetical protein
MHHHQKPAEGVKVSFAFQAVEENSQGRLNRGLTEALKGGVAPGLGAETFAVQDPARAGQRATNCACKRPGRAGASACRMNCSKYLH